MFWHPLDAGTRARYADDSCVMAEDVVVGYAAADGRDDHNGVVDHETGGFFI